MFKKIKAALTGKSVSDARALAESDPRKALLLLETLAEAGDAAAMCDLAASYEFGTVCWSSHKISVNIPKAAFWYGKLRQLNNFQGFEGLWQMYYRVGEMEKAADALKVAANAGIPNSMRFLAGCYFQGDASFRQNFSEGLMWMRKSAKTGDFSAQTELAEVYRDGKVVEKDLVKAYMWFVIASAKERSENQARYGEALRNFRMPCDSRDYEFFKPKEPSPGKAELARNELATILSKEQILKAQKMAETCVSVNYNGFD